MTQVVALTSLPPSGLIHARLSLLIRELRNTSQAAGDVWLFARALALFLPMQVIAAPMQVIAAPMHVQVLAFTHVLIGTCGCGGDSQHFLVFG